MVARNVDVVAVDAVTKAVNETLNEIEEVNATIEPIMASLSVSIKDGHAKRVEEDVKHLSRVLKEISKDLSTCKNRLNEFIEKIRTYADSFHVSNENTDLSGTSSSRFVPKNIWESLVNCIKRICAFICIPFIIASIPIEIKRDMVDPIQSTVQVIMPEDYDRNQPLEDIVIFFSDIGRAVAEIGRENRRREEYSELAPVVEITTSLGPNPP